MKRIILFVPLMAMVMGIICSCGDKKEKLAATDSAVVESTEIEYNKEDVEKALKAFLSEYINHTNDNLDSFLSEDYKKVIEKYCSTVEGEWNLFGLASAEWIERYTILCLTEPEENRASAHVKLLIECEGSYEDYDINIHLKLEKDKWVIDEIGELKQNMKFYLIENGKE